MVYLLPPDHHLLVIAWFPKLNCSRTLAMAEPSKPHASPRLSWQIKLFSFLTKVMMKLSKRKDGTINRRLLDFIDFKVPADGKPRNGVSTTDVVLDPAKNLWFRVFTPLVSSSSTAGFKVPVIVYFHGGGFVFLSPSSKVFDDLCRRLARDIPAVIVSVNYRLAPENRYPTPYDDGVTVIDWLAANGSDMLPETADLSRCFLAGDSAGGNIVHHVGIQVAAATEKFRPMRVAGILAIQPFFGGVERLPSELRLKNSSLLTLENTDFSWKSFLPENSDRDHPAANVFGPNSPDISTLEFPAIQIFVGGFDLLQDRQKLYYEGLQRSGKVAELIEYPNAVHGFYGTSELPESSLLISDMRAFIEKHGQ